MRVVEAVACLEGAHYNCKPDTLGAVEVVVPLAQRNSKMTNQHDHLKSIDKHY